MDVWLIVLFVSAAGAVGGIVNALITDNGFILPKSVTSGDLTILRAGALGNLIIGAVAAGVSWGLYGPLADALVIGTLPADAKPIVASLSISTLFTAVLLGIGGARWLTNEIDKKLLRAAATEAASSDKNDAAGDRIAVAAPASALEIAKGMH
jgi:hypothetical protein